MKLTTSIITIYISFSFQPSYCQQTKFLGPTNTTNTTNTSNQYPGMISPIIVKSIRPTTSQLQFRKTDNKTILQKLKGSLYQVIIGFILFNLSFVLLFFNERRSMKQLEMLDKAYKAIIVIDDDNGNNIAENEFIFISDDIKVARKLKDQFLNSEFLNTRKLSRLVEMYQNVETKTEKGEQVEYSYKQEWKADQIDSSQFNDQTYSNDNHNWIVLNYIHENKEPKICNIDLSDDFIRLIDVEEVVQMRDDMIAANFRKLVQMNSKIYAVQDNYIYIKKVEEQDSVGDMRVIYNSVKCGPYTLAGQYQQGKLVKYNISKYQFGEQQPENQNDNDQQNNNKQMDQQNEEEQPLVNNQQQDQQQTDSEPAIAQQVKQYCGLGLSVLECICQPQNEISWAEQGVLTKDEFFEKQKQRNSKDTNGIRKRGYMLMVFGVASLFAPIIVLLESVPYVQPYLGLFGKYAIVFYSLILSAILSLLTIILGRLTYDPKNPVLIVLLILTLLLYWNFRIF